MKRLFPPFYNFLSLEYWFGEIDSRPLAVFRILFGALLFKDALFHLPLAYWFYSDEGIVSLSTMDIVVRFDRFSLMDAMPFTWMAITFFVLWALVNLCLMLGYRTRLMAVLNFLMIVSIHERNIYVLSGADTTLRVMSFWAMFLPMGQYYSLDALRARWSRYARSHVLSDLRAPAAPQTAFAFPVRLAQIQVGIIYFFTFILKLPGEIWRRGEALFYTFQLQTLTLPTADWLLLNAPDWLLKLMTYVALVIEGSFIPLVFSPVGQPYLRMLGLFLGMMLHVGIGVLMAIQDFSLVMMISYFTLFEARWIVWLDKRLRLYQNASTLPQPNVDSPLWLLLALTGDDEIQVVDEPIDESPDTLPIYDSWQIKDTVTGDVYTGVAAWQRAAGHLPLSRLWGRSVQVGVVRRFIWTIGCHLIRRETPPAPTQLVAENAPIRRPNWVMRVAVFAFLSTMMVSVLWWNLGNVTVDEIGTPLRVAPMPYDLSRLVWYTGMWQYWGMFSPYPSTIDGWIEVQGRFEDATMFDLRTGERPLVELPRFYWGPVARWKKFEENMNRERNQAILSAWGAYYCDLYNNQMALPYGHRLATLDIVWRYRDSYPPGYSFLPYQEVVLWHQWCYEEYAPTN